MVGTEFVFSDRDFDRVRGLVTTHTGIHLSDAKRDMVYSRLARQLRRLGLSEFRSYCELLETGDEGEVKQFVNSITTNLTSFFRERHHFDHLKKETLPRLLTKNAQSKRIRIWSAGCSTGEEPYSIAMTIAEVVPADWDVRILATDLDTNVLDTGRRGVYRDDRVEPVEMALKRKYLRRGKGANEGKVAVVPKLRDYIVFNRLNLMGEWPMKSQFDVIFCRNVAIYFDKPTQRILFDRYAEMLKMSGHLYIGHSETLYRVSERFELLGKTIYRRTK